MTVKKHKSMRHIFTFDNIWKMAMSVLLVMGIYLNANYVTIQKFEALRESNNMAHSRITEVLSQVNTSISLLQANQKIIEDMRLVQSRLVVDVADIKARITILEKNK